MSERKVLNKYYPPDFDPAKIPRKKQPKNLQMKVRMMLPMSIRCNTCGNYIYKGTKFNCRKEDVVGDMYLGIMKFRFYFKCTKCSAELVMKTDPQNSDYEMEAGASRNFEPWREKDEVADALRRQREEEELGDAMKALENRTLDSKQEMDILAALDEMKSMKARQAGIDAQELLQALQRSGGQQQPVSAELTEEDEAVIKSMVFKNSENYIHRIEEGDEGEDENGIFMPDSKPTTTSKRKVVSGILEAEFEKPKTKVAKAEIGFQARLAVKPAAFIVKPKVGGNSTKEQTGPKEIAQQTSLSGANGNGPFAGLDSLIAYSSSEEDDEGKVEQRF